MEIEKLVNVEAVKEWWLQLTRRYYELQKQIEPLREERSKVEDLRGRLVRVLEGVGVKTDEIQQLENSIREELDARRQAEPVKVSDMAYEVLLSFGKPTHYKVILDGIKERGGQVAGSDPGTNLIAHMLKDKRFRKATEVGKGFYELREREEQRTGRQSQPE